MGCGVSKSTTSLDLSKQEKTFDSTPVPIKNKDNGLAPSEVVNNGQDKSSFSLSNASNGYEEPNKGHEVNGKPKKDLTENEKQPKVRLAANPIIPRAATETDVEKHMATFRLQQEINTGNLLQQQMRSKLLLEEKLRQRRQKKKNDVPSIIVQQPNMPEANAQIGQESRDDRIDEAPRPLAPITSKDVLYSEDNISLFTDLEKYAVSMESNVATFDSLMENLYIHDLSDLEKVRILFHWITAQDLNAIKFPIELTEDSPLSYLKAIKDEIKSYAFLFSRLCRAAGLHSKYVQGYLKGVGYFPDYKFSDKGDPLRGTWNAVLVDGQWRLIDTHWGARHVTEESSVARENWQTEYRYEEHYFLTDPDKLINTHFPDEPAWQLLKNPTTLDHFEASIKQWPLYYKLNLNQSTHHTGIILPKGPDGHVQIKLKVPTFARGDAKFKGELRRRKAPSDDSINLQSCVFHHNTESEEIFDVFLPQADQYLFKVFALSKKFSEGDLFTNVCLYQINCSTIKSQTNNDPKPPFPLVNFCFGPSKPLRDIGLVANSHPRPIVECDEKGEAKIILSVLEPKAQTTYTNDLHDYEGRYFKNSVVHALEKGNNSTNALVFYLRVPGNGSYALTLFSSDAPDSEPGQLSPFCHYLVVSRRQSKNATYELFPEVPNGALGSIQPDFDELRLCRMNTSTKTMSSDNWVKADSENGEAVFAFSHTQPIAVIASLLTTTEEFNDYAMVATDGSHTTITVRSPPSVKPGSFLLLKLYAAPIQQAKGVPCVFTAFVEACVPKKHSGSLSQAPSRVWGPCVPKFYTGVINSVEFHNSVSAVTFQQEKVDGLPLRLYNGGGDFEMAVSQTQPMLLKPKMVRLEDTSNIDCEPYVMINKSVMECSTVVARFPQPGTYALSLYGESASDQCGQLSPLYHVLIIAEKESNRAQPFPSTLNVWTTSYAHIISPLSNRLERNKVAQIRLSLGRYLQSGGGMTCVPYNKVLLLVDDVTPQEASNQPGTCDYQWDYIAGPGESKVGVIVQTSEETQAMNYALVFTVADQVN